MLKGRLVIEPAEEISDPQRGWICDLFDSMIEGACLIFRAQWLHGKHDDATGGPLSVQKGFGVPVSVPLSTMVPFRPKEIAYGRLARGDICLLMSDFDEPC